jgi:hypothetical protein
MKAAQCSSTEFSKLQPVRGQSWNGHKDDEMRTMTCGPPATRSQLLAACAYVPVPLASEGAEKGQGMQAGSLSSTGTG